VRWPAAARLELIAESALDTLRRSLLSVPPRRYGEGRVSGEAIDMRTRSIRRGCGHGTSEREALSSEIGALACKDPACDRSMSVPGIGPIISSAMVAARALFCCLDVQNGLTLTSQRFSLSRRFVLAPWRAEFGRARHPGESPPRPPRSVAAVFGP
jgi:hypothetical protein